MNSQLVNEASEESLHIQDASQRPVPEFKAEWRGKIAHRNHTDFLETIRAVLFVCPIMADFTDLMPSSSHEAFT